MCNRIHNQRGKSSFLDLSYNITAVPTFTKMLFVSYCFNLYNYGFKGGVDLMALRGDLFDPSDPNIQDGARQTYEFWQTDFLAVNGFSSLDYL